MKFYSAEPLVGDWEVDDEAEVLTVAISRHQFTLQCVNYPKDCMLFTDDGDMETVKGSIQSIVEKLLKKHRPAVGAADSLTSSSQSNAFTASNFSQFSENDGDDDESASWRGASQSNQLGDGVGTHDRWKESSPVLVAETSAFRALYGDDALALTPVPVLEKVEVDMIIDVANVLSPLTANAWGISTTLPLVLRLTVDEIYDFSRQPPAVALFQLKDTKPAPFKLQFQIENLMREFVKEQWSNKQWHLKPAAGVAPSTTTTHKTVIDLTKEDDEIVDQQQQPQDDLMELARMATEPDAVDLAQDQQLSQLVEMGFEIADARTALRVSGSSLPEALVLLTEQPEMLQPQPPQQQKRHKSLSPHSSAVGAGAPARRKSVNSLFDGSAAADGGGALRAGEHKQPPDDAGDGFLGLCLRYLLRRLPTLNDYCVICDQPHVFSHGNMLKPAVCSRTLCCWSFQQMGVAASCADAIATSGELVDLLVCMARIAACSNRASTIFEPYPLIFDPRDKKKKVLDPARRDFQLLQQILDRFPSVQEMNQALDFSDMKRRLDRAHPHAFDLLQWIITSNRSHMIKIEDSQLVPSMDTSFQYMLLQDTPEREAQFHALKAQHGTVFAFHGSSRENWHSILRQGLKNASGTKLQMHGAAHGSGVYLSPAAATSFGYCRSAAAAGGGRSTQRFLNSENLVCIAICEVINKDIRKSGDIWVQPNENYVVTRFLMAYVGGHSALAVAARTQPGNTKLAQELNRTMQFYLGDKA